MRTFELHRIEDVSGISGVGIVAQGFEFDDGTCVLRWTTARRSTAIYSSSDEVEAIHGHAGATRVIWTSDVYRRARMDCIQDGCENAPFASIGGLEKRSSMVCPKYISRGDEAEYLRGYRETALVQYGPDWDTCSFGWGPAMVINEPAQSEGVSKEEP
jgi:hypothetical protein